jgi:NAD(P)-dependent dehydrogenase (short-subunit alcohol dehydrogenase family)
MPRSVVVTGASGGLGRAIALEFARHGDQVALLARDAERLQAAADEVKRAGGRALPLVADVATWSDVEGAARDAQRELGPIDVWVNNAMSSVFAPFKDVTVDEFTRATSVTYLGFVHGTKAALDTMLPRDRGVIVQVGSALAYRHPAVRLGTLSPDETAATRPAYLSAGGRSPCRPLCGRSSASSCLLRRAPDHAHRHRQQVPAAALGPLSRPERL